MTQFNLLPDVKMQYIRAKNLKRTVMVVSSLVAAGALAIFILLFLTVDVYQKLRLDGINKKIATNTSTLKSTPDLNKVLTIQNQLNSLPTLNAGKPVVSRLFNYLSQVTPLKLSIGKMDTDFTLHTFDITGAYDTLATVNQFTDALKFTNYSYSDSAGKTVTAKAFSNVVLANFSRTDQANTYEVTCSFNPDIFDTKKNVTLTVPNITSTRSTVEQPTDLFKALPGQK